MFSVSKAEHASATMEYPQVLAIVYYDNTPSRRRQLCVTSHLGHLIQLDYRLEEGWGGGGGGGANRLPV